MGWTESSGDVRECDLCHERDCMPDGVMSTPAVTVDGLVKLSGGVPATTQLHQWIAG